jgi:hypothetical protein
MHILKTVPWKIEAGKFNCLCICSGALVPNVFTFRLLDFRFLWVNPVRKNRWVLTRDVGV